MSDVKKEPLRTRYLHQIHYTALEQAGWDVLTQIREEFPLTKGRVIVRGKLHTRAKHKRADYILENAFSCGFLRNLMKDNEIYRNYPARKFFSIFDFDEAFNDWNQLGQDIQVDPCRCLTKKHRTYESYALLLPVPANPIIRKQVINPNSGGNYGNRSLLTIEHLFYGIAGLDSYFVVDTERTDDFIKFINDAQKVPFARDIVPTLDAAHFEVFKPIFEFIKPKC